MKSRPVFSSSRRWIEIAAAAVIIAIPVALAAVTWEPLEPLPVIRPAEIREQERAVMKEATTTPEWRPRQPQRERERQERRAYEPPRVIATPGRAPEVMGTSPPQTQDAP